MGIMTLVFIFLLSLAALLLTLVVRREFLNRERLERERQHYSQHTSPLGKH